MQSRHVLPAWFGVGHALERFMARDASAAPLLREMMGAFPFFQDVIRNVEIGLAKADLSIAARYAELVTDAALRDRVFTIIADEFACTRRGVLTVTGQSELLETNDPGQPAAPQARRQGWPRPGLCAGRDDQRHLRGPAQYWVRSGVP